MLRPPKLESHLTIYSTNQRWFIWPLTLRSQGPKWVYFYTSMVEMLSYFLSPISIFYFFLSHTPHHFNYYFNLFFILLTQNFIHYTTFLFWKFLFFVIYLYNVLCINPHCESWVILINLHIALGPLFLL